MLPFKYLAILTTKDRTGKRYGYPKRPKTFLFGTHVPGGSGKRTGCENNSPHECCTTRSRFSFNTANTSPHSPTREFALATAGISILIWLYTISLVKREKRTTAKVIILVITTINLYSIIYATGGLTQPTIFTLLFLLAIANLLFPRRGAIVYGSILLILVSILYALSFMGMVPEASAQTNAQSAFLNFVFTLVATATVLTIASGNFRRNLEASRGNEIELRESNKELIQLRDELELRVQERTSALEQRATRLQAISSVARSIASIQDIDTLLPDITKLVSQQFGFYHVGIFLIDDQGEYAVLRAANSEGGVRMLERQHKLKLDSNSIVGYATSHGESRIALDVGTDAVYFNNPDLPATRSEMALLLRTGERIVGALDVQSTQSNAFTQEDIATLNTLADQVSIAIENARLFEEAQIALSESQATIERYVKQEWLGFARQVKHKGFIFDGKQVTPLDSDTWQEKTKVIPQTGSLSLTKTSSTLAVPIKLRGQLIGILDVRARQGQREWKQDEISLLEAAAERAALALENARLVESAQRRVARERTIGDISTRIGAVSNLESIMQAAVEELGRRIGGAAEVTIEIDSTNNEAV